MSETHETAGFVAPEPAQLAPLFPGYEIQGLIATGGMGAVYRAVQKSLDRTVALKILPMEFSSDAAFCAGFEAEAKAMARLNHPNLIGVYDFGEVNGMLYIIMEYVAGQSLYHATYGQTVEQSEAVRLVTSICNGLAHAHEYGIIHRDIKPSNILLDLNGQPKIGDFGLARPAERKIEEGEEIFGTPHYTAPEVVNAPQSVDYRADIFSVGVLLHELLTAQLPANDPRPASTIVRCDTRFDTIIRRATQPLAAARYASAAEMARDLQAIGDSLAKKTVHPAVAGAPRRTPAARVYPTRKKSSGNGAIVVVLLVVAGAAIFGYLHFSKTPPAKTAVPGIVVVPPKSSKPATPPKPTGSSAVEPESNLLPGRVPPSTDPTAVVDPDKEKVALPDPDPTVPGTTPNVPAAKFDVPAFLVRARGIMKEKAQTQLSVYQSSLRGNLTNYKRDLMREVGKVKFGSAEITTTLQSETAAWDKAGGRIPAEVPLSLSTVPGIEGIHGSYVLRQSGLRDTFQQALSPLSALYITGLEKQIERLQADNDAGAVSLINDEIKETKSNAGHFPALMLGLPPADE